MKTVILAGGIGTRLSEETVVRPKSMVEIGGMQILYHIMKMSLLYNYNDIYNDVLQLGKVGLLSSIEH